MTALLEDASTDDDLAVFVARHASVLTGFGPRTQDSGNVSWLVETGGRPPVRQDGRTRRAAGGR